MSWRVIANGMVAAADLQEDCALCAITTRRVVLDESITIILSYIWCKNTRLCSLMRSGNNGQRNAVSVDLENRKWNPLTPYRLPTYYMLWQIINLYCTASMRIFRSVKSAICLRYWYFDHEIRLWIPSLSDVVLIKICGLIECKCECLSKHLALKAVT